MINNSTAFNKNALSYKDPSGYVFTYENTIYRLIKNSYKNHFEHFIKSGLFQKLCDLKSVVFHQPMMDFPVFDEDQFIIIKPQKIPVISYPYEWSFVQLKEAALLTLKIIKYSLEYGMILKDASAWNIQFTDGAPILIDTLSFEIYNEGQFWQGHRQFIEQFFIPLKLAEKKGAEVFQLFKHNLNGIPVKQGASLLPLSTYFNLSSLLNIHLYAWISNSSDQQAERKIVKRKTLSKMALLGMVNNFEKEINSMHISKDPKNWAAYYSKTNNYEQQSFTNKETFLKECLIEIKPLLLLDIGANTGHFSRIATQFSNLVVSVDNDYEVISYNYIKNQTDKIKNILPLILDITNPSPGLGLENKEYQSFFDRIQPDTIMALALIHHLYFKQYVSFDRMSKLFSNICSNLIIEFVDVGDSQISSFDELFTGQFANYNKPAFEKYFSNYFDIIKSTEVADKFRTIYYMKRKD